MQLTFHDEILHDFCLRSFGKLINVVLPFGTFWGCQAIKQAHSLINHTEKKIVPNLCVCLFVCYLLLPGIMDIISHVPPMPMVVDFLSVCARALKSLHRLRRPLVHILLK